ncbi:MAG: phage terminase large subunit [bacterium]|jgi:predicted phage terminase large subunit-like protein
MTEKSALHSLVSPATFAVKASKGRWLCAKHLDYLNNRLLEVAAGRLKRLMVFLPPRHGKSEFISKYFAAWYLGTFPDRKIILTSYEADFAAQWGRRARELIEEHGGLSFLERVEVSSDSSAASRWDIKGHAGGMVTAGVGGPITGKGANLILIDDPVKNAEQAASETYREKTWEWYRSTLYTRLEPGGAIILIMTRWHEDDLGGRLLEDMRQGGDQWAIINFPALAEEGDPLGRSAGDPLWPDRFSLPELEKVRRTLGSYFWAALYQQRPAPSEGGLFKRHWFEIVGAYPSDCNRVRRWDIAATAKGGDYTCGLLLGEKDGAFYVIDVRRTQENPAGVEALIRQTADLDGPDTSIRMEQEPGSSGKGIIDHYARYVLRGYAFKGVPSTGSKVERARPVSAAAEAGNVKIVRGSWNAAFLDEVSAFPTGKHDDIVDTLSGSFSDLTLGGFVRGDGPSLEEALGDPAPSFGSTEWDEIPGFG